MVALALSHPLMWVTQIQHQMEIFKRCLWTRNQSAGGPRGTQTKVEDSPPLLPFLKHLLSSCYMPDCSEYQRYNSEQSRQKNPCPHGTAIPASPFSLCCPLLVMNVSSFQAGATIFRLMFSKWLSAPERLEHQYHVLPILASLETSTENDP